MFQDSGLGNLKGNGKWDEGTIRWDLDPERGVSLRKAMSYDLSIYPEEDVKNATGHADLESGRVLG